MFVLSPNLPIADAVLAAVSGTYPQIAQALRHRGIRTIAVPPFRQLSAPVCAHADMALHHLGGNRILLAAKNDALERELEREGFRVTVSNVCISEKYPYDVPLNAARIGNRLFARLDALATEIAEVCRANNIEMIDVRQGYAKCSSAAIGENALITEDPTIAAAARQSGMEVLQVSAGAVTLPGCRYGFLGGACGMIGRNCIAFTGSLDPHPDAEKIRSFCLKHRVAVHCLTNGPLLDIGGILTLKTKSKKESSA